MSLKFMEKYRLEHPPRVVGNWEPEFEELTQKIQNCAYDVQLPIGVAHFKGKGEVYLEYVGPDSGGHDCAPLIAVYPSREEFFFHIDVDEFITMFWCGTQDNLK